MKRPVAKKTRKLRPWTKDDILALNKLAHDGVKTTIIARKLKRTETATRQKAGALGVKLGATKRKSITARKAPSRGASEQAGKAACRCSCRRQAGSGQSGGCS